MTVEEAGGLAGFRLHGRDALEIRVGEKVGAQCGQIRSEGRQRPALHHTDGEIILHLSRADENPSLGVENHAIAGLIHKVRMGRWLVRGLARRRAHAINFLGAILVAVW